MGSGFNVCVCVFFCFIFILFLFRRSFIVYPCSGCGLGTTTSRRVLSPILFCFICYSHYAKLHYNYLTATTTTTLSRQRSTYIFEMWCAYKVLLRWKLEVFASTFIISSFFVDTNTKLGRRSCWQQIYGSHTQKSITARMYFTC